MGTGARGFLLFSFAFSSVLSSPEIGVSSESAQAKWNTFSRSLLNSITNNNVAIKRDYILEKSRSHLSGANIAKREISNSLNNKIGSFESSRDKMEPGGRRSFSANEVVLLNNGKRARVGFTGMRGKKDGFLSGNYIEKRNPLESADLKGRGLNEFLGLIDKKSGTGVSGMRGKKYDDYYDKLKEVVFHGMRGKKDYYGPYDGDILEWDSFPSVPDKDKEIFGDGWEEKTTAFHGVNGRNANPVKRNPLAFQVTGNDVYGYDFNRDLGFLGMRGKKSPESWDWENNSKRRTQSNYFGTKGKKAQSGFFGMRGKKSLPGCLRTQEGKEFRDNEVNTNSISSPMKRIRRGTIWLRNSKKAKNAFFAVRGKKSSVIFKR